jgi:hypothetical protein
MYAMLDNLREFEDERFYGLLITNDGGTTFSVQEINRSGEYAPIDEFNAVERPGQGHVSERFARQQAQGYFDKLAASNYGAEQAEEEPTPVSQADVDAIIARSRAERDPTKAAALRQQALAMMALESERRGGGNSRALCLVELLLA